MALKRFAYVVFLLLVAFAASAQPYKWVNEYGQTCYGDVAPYGMPFEPCFVPPPPPPDPVYERRVQAINQYLAELEARRYKIRSQRYDKIVITYPSDNGFVRDDGTGIDLSVLVDPELRVDDGHLIQIWIDGERYGKGGTELKKKLVDVNRGRHTVVAHIVDADGTTLLRSAPVSFHYQVEARLHTVPFYLEPHEPVPPEWSTKPFPPVVPSAGGVGAAPNMIPPGYRERNETGPYAPRPYSRERRGPVQYAPRAPRARNVPPARWSLPPPVSHSPSSGGGYQ
jgi:hypothetical protein